MGGGENGNASMVDTSNTQGGDGGPLPKPILDQGIDSRGAKMFRKKWQCMFHVAEQFLEVFFAVKTSCGKDLLIFPNPIWDI
jgi:hypothetical protein